MALTAAHTGLLAQKVSVGFLNLLYCFKAKGKNAFLNKFYAFELCRSDLSGNRCHFIGFFHHLLLFKERHLGFSVLSLLLNEKGRQGC